jgi:hypothetical protein
MTAGGVSRLATAVANPIAVENPQNIPDSHPRG